MQHALPSLFHIVWMYTYSTTFSKKLLLFLQNLNYKFTLLSFNSFSKKQKQEKNCYLNSI